MLHPLRHFPSLVFSLRKAVSHYDQTSYAMEPGTLGQHLEINYCSVGNWI